jgi:hypothetical protein
MPRVGLEPTIPVFEWAKKFRALDRAVTVIGKNVKNINTHKKLFQCKVIMDLLSIFGQDQEY